MKSLKKNRHLEIYFYLVYNQMYNVQKDHKGVKEYFQKHNMPILPPTVMNKAISFLASPASEGITGEKIIGKDIDEWMKARGINFEF